MTTKHITRCYGKLEKFFFTIPLILFLELVLSIYNAHNDLEIITTKVVISLFLLGFVLLSCPITVLMIVKKRAKHYKEKYIIPKFMYDCVKFLLHLIFFWILAFISLAKFMGFMKTNWIPYWDSPGDTVLVKYLGNNVYETSDGKRYERQIINGESVLLSKDYDILRHKR